MQFEITLLAKRCEDAAVYMTDTCNEVLEQNMLLDNMCLVQAFIFAAALILGLVMFSQTQAEKDLEIAPENALGMMRKLSTQSLQAEHYSGILDNMHKDIKARQQQTALQRRGCSGRPANEIVQPSQVLGASFPGLGPSNIDRGDGTPSIDELAKTLPSQNGLLGPQSLSGTGLDSDTTKLDWDIPSYQCRDDFSMITPE
ncbi:uncharacterized protein Z519_06151 [Cladophialophora bantiana CBS 173.52]|uniref:Uncharacterized protein n=1 Tax=Cladophialophora bantiana (strain ATCC 10958 / CBS 173.52 / CDC B-1940 / NIH 8579) TaxID=1442370 RepID=A0A0D2EUM4_CLAB1|nr:uncharacterized protein Z519_06151 [Cladophialophora bantiana CBS 173.52]KIW93546.1 hypothetical protein Z519_06151 [Cladophialophora bantiana CBS 173.52]